MTRTHDCHPRLAGILKALLHLVSGLTLSVSVGFAEGSDAPQSAIAKLAQTGKVSCQPSLPVFCSNIHVSCSGPSSVRTFPFKLGATRTHGSIESIADTAGIAEQYENGRVEWHNDDAYIILRPHQANGYIKMLADGSYSFRHYAQHAGTMSRGHCN